MRAETGAHEARKIRHPPGVGVYLSELTVATDGLSSPVGVGLLANAVGQSVQGELIDRLRGQARSHIFEPWPLLPRDASRIWTPTASRPMTAMSCESFTGDEVLPRLR